ncbi:MAG TPA: SGNH/GDSL hydrolase family protein [Smithella sp.]|nr:SGNH/GDSL hydrolase family protein [Smithella sp.]
MKLLIRGGSVAAGYGAKKNYADILTERLEKKGVTVINRSRCKETSFDGVRTFHLDIGAFRPDMLLLHFGIDDAFGYVYRSEFQENIVRMVRLAREEFNPVVFLATSQTFDNPYDMDAVCLFYRSLQVVASDLSCVLIPIHFYWANHLLENRLTHGQLLQSDARYPNEHGHRVIAQAILASLNNFL